jgi:hypothetical protein
MYTAFHFLVLKGILKFGSEAFRNCGAIAIINNSQQREEKIVCERAQKAAGTHTHDPPTAKLAKPAGGWDEDFVVNNFRV